MLRSRAAASPPAPLPSALARAWSRSATSACVANVAKSSAGGSARPDSPPRHLAAPAATAWNSAGARGARRLLHGVDPMAPDRTAQRATQPTAQSTGGSTMRRIVPGVLVLIAPVALSLVAIPLPAEEHAHTVALPATLEWAEPAPLPGALLAVVQGAPSPGGLFAYRLKRPAGYALPPHQHQASENVPGRS